MRWVGSPITFLNAIWKEVATTENTVESTKLWDVFTKRICKYHLYVIRLP